MRGDLVVQGRDQRLPFSRGLLASSIMITGLAPDRAFVVAEQVEQHLTARDSRLVPSHEVRELTASLLARLDELHASRYRRWQLVGSLDRPLVILLGGVTGVGKSTAATQLAARLELVRVISTDSVREVLRAVVPQELLPALHSSSFNATPPLTVPATDPTPGRDGTPGTDHSMSAFQEQVQAVSVGIKALIARAVEERTSIIIEGAHVVPGCLPGWEQEFPEALLVPVLLTVSDRETHKDHFVRRAQEVRSRSSERYLEAFDSICLIQSYMCRLAEEHQVPLVEVADLDTTLQEIIAIVADAALR
ncbi:AAA family ATPase [Streptomyces sp. PA5.6]|uniref:AAA family ATPase n=1 Tax=Streptomyces sp. PA5.6 TaxID=3035651 RepID=UPI0039049CD0